MPNHTVSGNVDTMMRAVDNAAIRSAIGVGQTDAPTFLAITLNDTPLVRDAPGILAQRNGVNAQAFRVYNTFLGTTANEWAELDWKTDGTLRLGTNQAGTGAIKAVNFVVGGAARWGISGTANPSTTGHLLATADNTYDIGASGANRPRHVYSAAQVIAGSHLRIPRDSGLLFASSATDPLSGTQLTLRASASAVNALCIGDTTDAFPAIARDGAGIKFTGGSAGLTSWIKVPAVAVSALPSAATAGVGARSFVNDALSPVFGSAVASGGFAKVPVYSDGTNWNVG